MFLIVFIILRLALHLIAGDLNVRQYRKYSEDNHWPFKCDLNVPQVLHVGQVTYTFPSYTWDR